MQSLNDNYAPLNKLELTSVNALLCYAAHNHNVNEGVVRAIVATHFGVDDVTQLTRQVYEDVIGFLVTIQVDMMLN